MLAREPDPVAAFETLRQYRSTGRSSPVSACAIPSSARVARAALALAPADAGHDRLVLAAAARGLAEARLGKLLGALAFEAVIATRSSRQRPAQTRLHALGAARTPSEIAIASPRAVSPESVALAGALGPAEHARDWLQRLRHVRLEIDGRDLMRGRDRGGPRDRYRAASCACLQARRLHRHTRAGARRSTASCAGEGVACDPMLEHPNALQWNKGPGHYEVYYVTLTDPATGVGVWIRYTMVAPLPQTKQAATASLWLLAMDPRPGAVPTVGRKATFEAGQLSAQRDPFELRIENAILTDKGMSGSIEDVSWDLRWDASGHAYEHVHPLLRRLGVAKTVLVLPHADLTIDGSIGLPDERLELSAARGGQAHLWGSKHAGSWAWVHCNDFTTSDGEPITDAFIDGVSVIVPRLGRDVGPSTPVVARIDGQDFTSTSPLRVIANPSTFALSGWRFEAVDGNRKLIGEVDADREQLAGVTYHDPDGELAYCYNSETASMRVHVYERARQVGGWAHRATLVANGRAHFEYAQRTPVPDLELLTK